MPESIDDVLTHYPHETRLLTHGHYRTTLRVGYPTTRSKNLNTERLTCEHVQVIVLFLAVDPPFATSARANRCESSS